MNDEYRIVRIDAWNDHLGDYTRWEIQSRETKRHKWRKAFDTRFVSEEAATSQLTATNREPVEVLHEPVVHSRRPAGWAPASSGYGILLRNGHINDNHGHAWQTPGAAARALGAFQQDSPPGSGTAQHFIDARVIDLGQRHLTVVH